MRAMRIFGTEFIGTFFLVLTIGCTGIASAPGVIPPLAIGAVLMVMVYAGGHISGAHYNPAVTAGAFLRGATPARDVGTYLVAQIAGALAAASPSRRSRRTRPARLPPSSSSRSRWSGSS